MERSFHWLRHKLFARINPLRIDSLANQQGVLLIVNFYSFSDRSILTVCQLLGEKRFCWMNK